MASQTEGNVQLGALGSDIDTTSMEKFRKILVVGAVVGYDAGRNVALFMLSNPIDSESYSMNSKQCPHCRHRVTLRSFRLHWGNCPECGKSLDWAPNKQYDGGFRITFFMIAMALGLVSTAIYKWFTQL